MKKILIALALLCSLTACTHVSSEDVTAGIRATYSDVTDIQVINLSDRDNNGRMTIECDSAFSSAFIRTEYWAIGRLKNQEVYLMKIARSVYENSKSGRYDYAICHKQKLF